MLTMMLDKQARRVRYNEDTALTVGKEDDGTGWLEGYASIFDVEDYGGEVVKAGAFAKTVAERVPTGKVKLMAKHLAYGGDSTDVVGTITEAKEDAKGLWIHAEFASTDRAQEVRTLAKEGHLSGLSIGYKPIRWEEKQQTDGTRSLELLEIKLMEVTLTARPMNDDARVTATKSLTGEIAELVDAAAADEGRELTDEQVARAKEMLAELDGARKQLSGLLAKSPHSDAEPPRFKDGTDMRRRLALARKRARAASL